MYIDGYLTLLHLPSRRLLLLCAAAQLSQLNLNLGLGPGLWALFELSVCLSTGHKKASVGYRTMIYFDKGVTHKYLSDFFTPFME